MSFTANLAGKTAMVTGASSGLGAHFAQILAGAGASVVACARRRASLDSLVDSLPGARAVTLDVTDIASVREAVLDAGDVHVLVNNAGITVAKPVLDQGPEDFDTVLDTNLRGAFLVATEVARGMRNRDCGGSIINIASILGLRQGGQVTPYAISKAGVIQMTRQLALELARYRIRVNALAPGYIATDLNRDFLTSPAGAAMRARIPQRRFGEMRDLDGPLLLLASDLAGYMTGSVISIDGGHLLSSL